MKRKNKSKYSYRHLSPNGEVLLKILMVVFVIFHTEIAEYFGADIYTPKSKAVPYGRPDKVSLLVEPTAPRPHKFIEELNDDMNGLEWA